MKKVILTIGILAGFVFFCQSNAFAYSVLWGTWNYQAETSAKAGKVDDFALDEDSSPPSSLPISSYAEKYYSIAYAVADAEPGELESSSYAASLARRAKGISNVLLSNYFCVVGGQTGDIIPTYLTGNLDGLLLNLGDNSHSEVDARVWFRGNLRLHFSESLDGEGLVPVDEEDTTMIYPKFGNWYLIEARLHTEADTQGLALASSIFSPDSFTFDVTPIPEPATMSLLGMGLLGLVGLRRKRG